MRAVSCGYNRGGASSPLRGRASVSTHLSPDLLEELLTLQEMGGARMGKKGLGGAETEIARQS